MTRNQLMIVVAVEHFDVHSGFSHAARDLAELTWFGLVEALHEHLAFSEDADARSLRAR